jgi:hypothetical protein
MGQGDDMNLLRALTFAAVTTGALQAAPAQAFDFDHEMAIFHIGPHIVPPIYAVSPTGSDASLVLRLTSTFTTSWYDATSPYSDNGVGVFSSIPRRPASESTTNANENIAIFYATYHVAMSVFPHMETEWRNLLLDVGLDPDDDSTDVTTAIGIGNVAGAAVVEAFENDGMNQRGDGNGRVAHLKPFEDTTGYQPVNTAYELKHPSRWQPQIKTAGNGIFTIQQFVTPQYGTTQGFAHDNMDLFTVPDPVKSKWSSGPNSAYKAQADEVLAISANLTDEQKMIAELFNDKLISLGMSTGFMFFTRFGGADQRKFIEIDFITHAATWDAGIACWKEKARHDAVRPFSAIRKLYAGQTINAWGGPGQGTVSMKGEHWESYLGTADHPEYPSGSSTFCAAHADAMRTYFGSDSLGWPVVFPAGSSRVEPGVVPATDITLVIDTWTEFEELCTQSRRYAGVHFADATTAGNALGHEVGSITAEWAMAHIDGSIAP